MKSDSKFQINNENMKKEINNSKRKQTLHTLINNSNENNYENQSNKKEKTTMRIITDSKLNIDYSSSFEYQYSGSIVHQM